MTPKEELQELLEVKRMIESKLFQEYIVAPIRGYQDKLKEAYNCKSLTELATIKGKKAGSEKFFDILKDIDVDFINKKNDVENSGE